MPKDCLRRRTCSKIPFDPPLIFVPRGENEFYHLSQSTLDASSRIGGLGGCPIPQILKGLSCNYRKELTPDKKKRLLLAGRGLKVGLINWKWMQPVIVSPSPLIPYGQGREKISIRCSKRNLWKKTHPREELSVSLLSGSCSFSQFGPEGVT